MSKTMRIATSAEVWAVIRARHPDMVVFGSFSDPDGSFSGGSRGQMMTEYGFRNCEIPLLRAETTWDIGPEGSHERLNEQHKYWLSVPLRDEE